MSELAPTAPAAIVWWKVLLGPASFLALELLFRPELELTPLLLERSPDASPEMVRHVLAATVWIACWWFTEALPIPATSLLPVALFPFLGVASAKTVALSYGDQIIFLFLGGFLLALAMERCNLHRRIAVRILRIFGQGERQLVLGFMVATAAMSMWISNTATTVMMLPVALAVLATRRTDESGEARVDEPFAVAVLLGIAYAANIGGLGTPVGSPPNLAFQKIYKELSGQEVSFLGWMLYGLPVIAALLPATWIVLVRRMARQQITSEPAAELPVFGPMSRAEKWVLGVFMITVVLWITRGDLGPFQGWGKRLSAIRPSMVVLDSTIAVAAALLLFIVPSEPRGAPILDWKVAPRLPWGVLLLMGAGFAISGAFSDSGLTSWIGSQLGIIGQLALPTWALFVLVLGAVLVISVVVTEFASNTASANILLPVIFSVAYALGPESFPPRELMIACALACTTGFAVPAGTPPNALVFATERISIQRFVRAGLLIDVLAMIAIAVVIGVAYCFV